jgi:hypothetical protein
VLVTAPEAATAPPAAPTRSGGEIVLYKDSKPLIGITYPADWKPLARDRCVFAVSADAQAYSMIAALEGVASKQAGVEKVKQGLTRYLQGIEYDDLRETARGALVLTGTGKAKKAGVPVVFAVGVFDAGAGQFVGAAFVVDARNDEYYQETIRQICQTIRVVDQSAEKR